MVTRSKEAPARNRSMRKSQKKKKKNKTLKKKELNSTVVGRMDKKVGDLTTKTTGHTRSKILQYGYIF